IYISPNLPTATVGQSYNAAVSVTGGSAPYQFAIGEGALPPGLSLNPATGVISGTPTQNGSFVFQVVVSDHPLRDHGRNSYSFTVNNPPVAAVSVNVNPGTVTLSPSSSLQFSAMVTNTSNTAVKW